MTERDGRELSDVIRYAVNSEKTQQAENEDCTVVHRFVSGINCSPATARDEMLAVKKRFGKENGTVAYHGYQSFAPGEVTPETAHEIGMKLAARLWGDRYQVIVATHLDKENHLHNHFVVNTVSFADGIKYHRTRKDYHEMQTVSDDPLFWQFMGVKYILAETRPEGYELYRDYGDFQVYRAISAAPVAYVTDQVVSETEYKSLPYPQNQEILETAAVIPDQEMRKTTAAIPDQEKSTESVDNFRAAADSDTKNGSVGPLFHSCFQKVNLEIPETDQEDLRIQKTADGYEIETKKSVTVPATLPGAAEGATLLAVSFEVENQKASHDMFIRINGQTNRLTGINHTYANGNTQFNYLVTMKEDGTAFIRMGKGHYILKNFETWTGMAQPLEKTEQLYSQAVTLIGGTTATYGGDGITGVLYAERDGYLITSIPYDENFVLKVDGKETLLFRANTAFLGAKIPSGEHKIVLVYHAPGRAAGSWCSLMGGMLALILVICEKKKQQNGSERAGESKMLQKQRKYYIIRV